MNLRLFLLAVPALVLTSISPGEVPVAGNHITVTPSKPRIVTIYENKFAAENSAGPEWSEHKLDATPAGNRPYLGGFVEEPVELALKKLPKHQLVRITFDLFLLRCWDGSSKEYGVKLFDLDVVDKQNLLHTTFSNAGFFRDNNEQAFPDSYPCRPLPAWTGAAEKQTLGTIMSWGGPERTWDSSGVYHFSLTFPHTDDNIIFRYKATMEKAKDKTWGVTNLSVDAISDFYALTDDELAKNWKTLGGNLSTEAYKALWNLTASAIR